MNKEKLNTKILNLIKEAKDTQKQLKQLAKSISKVRDMADMMYDDADNCFEATRIETTLDALANAYDDIACVCDDDIKSAISNLQEAKL